MAIDRLSVEAVCCRQDRDRLIKLAHEDALAFSNVAFIHL